MAYPLDRRAFLVRSLAASAALAAAPGRLLAQDDPGSELDPEVVAKAQALADLQFTEEERVLMASGVDQHLAALRAVRELQLPNEVPPALRFVPDAGLPSRPRRPEEPRAGRRGAAELFVPRRASLREEDLPFAPVHVLAAFVRHGDITSTRLTQLCLERLKRLDPTLEFVVTLTEERALDQAARADREIAQGRYRGPLHGIPWGAKDILAVADYRTTWGAMPYRDQHLQTTAEVVRRLDDAGAVLVAKTTVGALAWGDVWFGGTTRNPWNPEQGSSGSSAGSASTVAAGAVPFALGSETLGSLVSPSTRCGVTSIRPTFGRVPRSGCMALSWSMDKIGPMTRSVADAALVLDVIQGSHLDDPDAVDRPLTWDWDPRDLTVGVVQSAFDQDRPQKALDDAVLDVLRRQGMRLVPLELPEFPARELLVILEVEAAAAFEQLTVSNRDDELVRQVEAAWPNVFRAAHLVSAVQLVQAQRARTRLMQEFHRALAEVDVYVCPSFGAGSLTMTNLTGHPAVVLPNGFTEEGSPTSITFTGRLFEEGKVCAVARAYQDATDWHRRHPDV